MPDVELPINVDSAKLIYIYTGIEAINAVAILI